MFDWITNMMNWYIHGDPYEEEVVELEELEDTETYEADIELEEGEEIVSIKVIQKE